MVNTWFRRQLNRALSPNTAIPETIDTVHVSKLDAWKSRKDFSVYPLATSNGIYCTLGSQMTIAGTFTSVAHTDALKGAHRNIASDGTDNFDAGIFGTNHVASLNVDPEIRIRFARVTDTLQLLKIGFFASTPMTADAPAIAQFGLSQVAGAGFKLHHSASGAPTEVALADSDTAVHELYLIADNANSRWGYSFDNAAITWVTANIPIATTMLAFYIAQRAEEAAVKNFKFWYAKGTIKATY